MLEPPLVHYGDGYLGGYSECHLCQILRGKMKKKAKAQLVHDMLLHHFPNPEIPLKHTSPYTLLIAVLLSAQCTDARVNLITPALFAKADTPEKMVELSIPEIEIRNHPPRDPIDFSL